ncbi:uncharacterized protein LOC142528320 [Primulina tabacum]|uniref:uncharacterized protein LOC142528320 n=1 Tax=Primulina tabacum TaxID=48773 RepID=UPI003F5ABDD2
MVASKFESLRMEDKESILEYDSRLRQLSNEAHSLGDPMSNERLVNKVLRSLPERFNVKVCAIEESKDTSTINLDELISSLRTFEMNLNLQKKDKGKTIALEVSTDSYDEILQISKEMNESDLGEDYISLITKKFGDYLKKMREKKKIGQKSVLPNITTSAKAQKFTPMKGQFRPRNELQIQSNVRNLDSVQCRECSGFGNYANECANRLRRNKGMAVTLSDEESDDDQGSNESENHTSLSAVINQSETQEVDDDEVTLESVQTMYEELYEDWIKRNKVNAILSKENTEMKSQEELGEATQILAKLNSSSSKLDSLLMIGKNDKAGLGYTNNLFETGESSNTERKPTVFVKESAEISNVTHTEKGVSSKRQISTKKSKSRKRHFICHYCFRPGHIKSYCFKLRDDYKKWESEQVLPQTNIAGIWYFDSGCSRHMTGSKDHLIDYVELRNGHVTYGGGAKGRIAGKGTLNVDGFPNLHNVQGLLTTVINLERTLCAIIQREKSDTFAAFKKLHAKITNLHDLRIGKIRTDHDLTGKTIKDEVDGILNISETLPNTDVVPGIDIPSKIQKNHSSSQIIGEALEGMQTRRKEKVDYRKMIGLVCMTSVYSQNKTDESGIVVRNKARLVAQGYTQIQGIDFDETFAPVARIESVRLLLAIACHMDIKLYQMDVKIAFLNGILNEEAYVSQPKGFEDPHHPDHVYKLKKALYGLKQAPRAWYCRLTEYLLDLGFKRGEYAKNLVKKFSAENTKHMKTPMGSTEKLSKDDVAAGVDNTQYRSIIGSLLYLSASRPDIMFSVCLCARYQADPKVTHLKAVKRILRYIAGIVDLGLWYIKETNSNLVGFSDADWAGNLDDRKSTTGGCFYLGNNFVSWYSRKQNCVSLSTAESEYVAAASCCSQLLWMNQMIKDYGFNSDTLFVYCDNSSAIDISKNPVQHSQTKHINIRHHFIRDLVEKGTIRMEFVETENQLADIFTKPLDFERFSNFRKSLSLCAQ